jgi:DNA-binding transcriptional regulator YiaG
MTATLAAVATHPQRRAKAINLGTGHQPTKAEVIDLRSSSGLTQTQFGALAYKTWRAVQEWESGERRMPPDTWQLIQVKIKARELMKRGRIAPQAVKDLGLELPGEEA